MLSAASLDYQAEPVCCPTRRPVESLHGHTTYILKPPTCLERKRKHAIHPRFVIESWTVGLKAQRHLFYEIAAKLHICTQLLPHAHL